MANASGVSTRRIFVTNLSFDCEEETLKQFFIDNVTGEGVVVDHAEVFITPEGHLTGNGAVEFGDITSTEAALQIGIAKKGSETIRTAKLCGRTICFHQETHADLAKVKKGQWTSKYQQSQEGSEAAGGKAANGAQKRGFGRGQQGSRRGSIDGRRGGRMMYRGQLGEGYGVAEEDYGQRGRMGAGIFGGRTPASLGLRSGPVGVVGCGRMGMMRGREQLGLGRPGLGRMDMMGGPMDMTGPMDITAAASGLPLHVLEQLDIDPYQLKPAVFAMNICREIEEDKLQEVFGLAGEVEDIDMFRKKDTNTFTGQVAVCFKSVFNAAQAISMLNQALLNDRSMIVRMDYKYNPYAKKRRLMAKSNSSGLPAGLASIGPGLTDRTVRKPAAAVRVQEPDIDPEILDALGLMGQPLTNKIQAGNLDYKKTTKEDLEQMFKLAGEVEKVQLHTNREGEFNGRALVEFRDATSAVQAISMFRDQNFWGRRLVVTMDHRIDTVTGGLSRIGPGFGVRGNPVMDSRTATFDAFDPFNPRYRGNRFYNNPRRPKREWPHRDDHRAPKQRKEDRPANVVYIHNFNVTDWEAIYKDLQEIGGSGPLTFTNKDRSKYGVVRFKDEDQAKEAASLFNGKEYSGQPIIVALTKQRSASVDEENENDESMEKEEEAMDEGVPEEATAMEEN